MSANLQIRILIMLSCQLLVCRTRSNTSLNSPSDNLDSKNSENEGFLKPNHNVIVDNALVKSSSGRSKKVRSDQDTFAELNKKSSIQAPSFVVDKGLLVPGKELVMNLLLSLNIISPYRKPSAIFWEGVIRDYKRLRFQINKSYRGFLKPNHNVIVDNALVKSSSGRSKKVRSDQDTFAELNKKSSIQAPSFVVDKGLLVPGKELVMNLLLSLNIISPYRKPSAIFWEGVIRDYKRQLLSYHADIYSIKIVLNMPKIFQPILSTLSRPNRQDIDNYNYHLYHNNSVNDNSFGNCSNNSAINSTSSGLSNGVSSSSSSSGNDAGTDSGYTCSQN
ncbi:hypothetical protein Glove_308g34 [Diversispora epigaea]|uniref:Uncharacterized protein n=1 Tax=Diversispora epigaea TaxID=1348612 RepID=A0A397HSZ9_9GLOM|nr:hypothetical protein Glove_308g34 [Diversispora epigaea]